MHCSLGNIYHCHPLRLRLHWVRFAFAMDKQLYEKRYYTDNCESVPTERFVPIQIIFFQILTN